MADRPVGSAKIVLSLDPTNLEKQLVTINHKLVDGMASIDAAYKAVGTKSGPAFEAMKANATAAMNTITAKGLASGEELVRIQQETAAKIAAITSQQYKAQEAAMAKANTANMEYQLAKRQYEQETLRQSIKAQEAEAAARTSAIEKANRANMEYQLAKRKYEKETASKSASDAAAPGKLLGFTSVAEFNKQRDAIISAYDAIGKSVEKGTRDHINLERAKNEKLKALNAEMVGSHETSMASMMRAVLRFYAAYYVVSTAIQTIVSTVMSGIKAIDDYSTNTIAIAAQITGLQGDDNVAENYKKAVQYAEKLNLVLMEVDANSFANYQQIQLMNRAMANHGVLIDTNNEKQKTAFTAITNMIALLTAGQDKERQASQEMEALMSGRIKTSDRVARQIDAMIKQEGIYKGGLKEVVELGNKHGDTLERLKPYTEGVAAAAGDISATWSSVSSSLETAFGIIQRGLFKDIYKDLVSGGREASEWIKKNSDDIIESVNSVGRSIKFAAEAATVFVGVWGVAAGAPMIIAGIQSSLILVNLALADGIFKLSTWNGLRQLAFGTESVFAIDTFGAALKTAFGVFAAAFAGFQVGEWLNKFESVRAGGVHMVYGIVDAWDYLMEKMKIGWEVARGVGKSLLDPTNIIDYSIQADANIAAIRRQYAEEKKERDRNKKEQLADVTEAAMAQAKAREKVINDVVTPKIKGNQNNDLKEYGRQHSELLKSMQDDNKHHYEDAINKAKEAEKHAQNMGQNELATIENLERAKLKALDERRAREEEIARLEINNEIKRAGDKKQSFDSQNVLQAKLHSIEIEYLTDADKVKAESVIKREEYAKKNAEVEANLYNTINQYSEESKQFEVNALMFKYLQYQRWTQKTIDLEKAKQQAIAELNAKSDLGKAQAKADVVGVISGTSSSAYNEAVKAEIEAQSKLEEIRANAAGLEFDRESWLNSKQLDFIAQQLESKASYFAAIEGMETESLAISLAAVEARRKADIAAGIDSTAAGNKAAQNERDEIISNWEQKNKYINSTITNTERMFDAASALYKQDSKEYKLMQDGKRAAQIAELAMEVSKNIQIISGYFSRSAAAVAAAAVQNAANSSTAVTGAVASVAAQGSIPVGGFAAVAAMIAVMSGVLGMAGIAFGGSGSSSSSSSASKPTSTNYSGTVLGDITASSESITNVTDTLMDIYADEYPELQRIRQEMIELNNNITGLVSSIVRNGGTFAGGITTIESPLKASIDNMANSMNQMLWSFDKYLAGFGTSFTIGPQLLSKAVGWVAEKLWGGGSKTWVTGSGIDLKDATLGGLSAGSGIGTRTYLDTRTKHDGGLFGDTHWSSLTQYGEVDEQTKALFDKVFVGMSESINQLGEAFGTNQQKIDNYKISIGKINLADKTGEEINKIITGTLSTAFDNAVASIFDISSYQKVGEGLYETAVRLVVDKEVILSSLDMIGMAFTGVANSMEAVDFAETLLGFSEDLETFTADVSKYFTTFFTEQEQFEWSTSQLRKALENINAELPLTRAGFKDLVSGLNLSTDAGKQAFVMLMGLTSAADDYYSALEKIIENAQDLSNKIYGELYSRELPTFEYENWQLAVQMAETLKSIAELGPEYAYLADQANRLFTLQKQEISDKTNKEVIALDEALSLEKPIDQWQTQIEEANDKAFDFLERIASLPAESAERLKGAIELWREDAIDEIVSKRDAENLNSTLNFLTFQRTTNGVSSTDETIARIANRREWGDSYGGVGNFDMQRLYDEQLRPFLTMSFDDLRYNAELMGMTWEDLASDTTALSEVFNSLRDEAKSAANTFDSLSQSIRDQIRGMETSLTNPADTLERLGIQKNAISEYLGGNSASGFIASLQDDSEKSSAITKLQGMYSEELELYKELYQRPSEGYQAGYREILTNLEELLGVSESLKTDYDLQYEQTDYLRQIAENTKNGAGSKKTDEDTVAPTSINVALDPSGHYTANDIVGLLQQLLPKILPGLIRQTGSIRTEVQNAGAGR